MTARARLPNRRRSETFAFCFGSVPFVATVGRFDDGRVAEIFLSSHKSGSDADNGAKDSAITASIALQYGAPFDVLRKALLCDQLGNGASPLSVALDLIAQLEGGA